VNLWLLLLGLGLLLWTTSWILVDWVLNGAVYWGMESPFRLIQIPFNPQVIYVSGWHAYQIGFIQCHVALIILVYAVAKLMGA